MIHLVTGANRGIGLEFVRRLLALGHTVHATARDPARASVLAGLTPHVHALDVGDEGSIARLAAALREVDVVINNAGTIGDEASPLGEQTLAGLSAAFAINAAGPLLLTQALLPAIGRGKRKLVVHITSRMGSIGDNSSGGYYSYRMSKAALNMASKSLALDLAPKGIISVVMHPGWVKTDMGGAGATLTPEESVRGMLKVIDGIDAKSSGKVYNYNGAEIAY